MTAQHIEPEALAAILSLDEATAEPEPRDLDTLIPPEDLARANRYARRLARLEKEASAIEAAAESRRAEIDAWAERELARIGRSTSWFVRSLELFLRSHHERGGPKSVRLSTGHTLSLTKPRGHVEVHDEKAFLHWADEAAPELIRWTAPKPAEPHPDKLAIAKLPSSEGVFLVDGEKAPGIEWVVAPEDVFKIAGDES